MLLVKNALITLGKHLLIKYQSVQTPNWSSK